MADIQMGAVNINIANSLKAIDGLGGTGTGFTSPTNYRSVGGLRDRLSAANPTYYTEAKLNQLTVNDMVFAVRSIDDRTTISNYQPVSTA